MPLPELQAHTLPDGSVRLNSDDPLRKVMRYANWCSDKPLRSDKTVTVERKLYRLKWAPKK